MARGSAGKRHHGRAGAWIRPHGDRRCRGGMAEVLVLSEADVAALLDLDEPLVALADAFGSLSAGRASVPLRLAAPAAAGLLGAVPVHLLGWRSPPSWSPSSRATATAPCRPTRACSPCSPPGTARRLPSWTAPTTLPPAPARRLRSPPMPRLPRRPRARDSGRRRAGPLAPGGPAAREGLGEVRVASRTATHAAILAARPRQHGHRLVRGGSGRSGPGVLLHRRAAAGHPRHWLTPGTHVSSASFGPSSTPNGAPAGSSSSGAARS